MHDFTGKRVKEALPGDPVEVLGFDGVPEAGEYVRAVENDRRARQLAHEREQRLKQEQHARRSGRKRSLEDVFKDIQAGELKELNLLVKADVAGSAEALEDEIAKLPQDEVAVNIIRTGVGGINESDVMLAAASDAIIIGFNVRPVGDARAVAEREGVDIRNYSVIYKVLDELRAAMEGMLEPEEVEDSVGHVEIRQIFRASKIGVIAGSYVTDGKITRGAKTRLVRDGTIVYDGEIASLRRLQRRRARGRGRLRVRHRAAQLPGRQGRRRPRGLRDAQGRPRAGVARCASADDAYVALLLVHLHFPDAGSLKAKRKDLASVKAQLHGRMGVDRGRGRPPGSVAARDARGGADGRLAARRSRAPTDRVERFLLERFPESCRIERTVASFDDGLGTRMASRSDATGRRGREAGLVRRRRPGPAGPEDRFRHDDERQDHPRPSPCPRLRQRARKRGRSATATLAGLRSAHGALQRRLARELRMKRTPTLEFLYDDTTDRAMHLEQLIEREAREA